MVIYLKLGKTAAQSTFLIELNDFNYLFLVFLNFKSSSKTQISLVKA